jgi:L-histidine N-alpha-methyltransferase
MSSRGRCETDCIGSERRAVEIVNRLDGRLADDISEDMQRGLAASQKYVPCKYFYDDRGSRLFEDICELPEYYPTRTELSILRAAAPRLMATSRDCDIIELGSGAGLKIRTLLEAADPSVRKTLRYIPVDISESAIIEASRDLLGRYPELRITGVVADFTTQLDFLDTERALMLCFLGSTIGNMSDEESASFLGNISTHLKPGDSLLVGFDMVKGREVMEAAYNDSDGVTSEFNKNVLNVINSQLKGDFDPSDFDHMAFFNEADGRIEMHLKAKNACSVNVESLGMEIEFREGETIHTENSRKFTRKDIEHLAHRAGLHIRDWFADPDGWFSLVLMSTDGAQTDQ